jgi:hypothetical protein
VAVLAEILTLRPRNSRTTWSDSTVHVGAAPASQHSLRWTLPNSFELLSTSERDEGRSTQPSARLDHRTNLATHLFRQPANNKRGDYRARNTRVAHRVNEGFECRVALHSTMWCGQGMH